MSRNPFVVYRLFCCCVLYTALLFGTSPAHADREAAMAARKGDMLKFAFHDRPQTTSSAAFEDREGMTVTLEQFKGQYVLINFWATWCAPCREEMPTLSQLQRELGPKGLNVMTIATGRNSPKGISAFFDKIGVDNLPEYRDPKQKLARDMHVLGLPVTVLIDPKGQEIARLIGDADWASDSTIKVLSAFLE